MNYNLSLKDSVIDDLLLWLNDNYEKIITTDGLVQQTGTSTTAVMSQKAVTDAIATKQDTLTFDPSPVSGSLNPVTSGGIFSAIESAKGAAGLAEALLDTDSEGTEQEFSLRKSGGDGGAYFRRLLGNTKAFNQLVENGDFSNGTTGWANSAGAVVSVADGVVTLHLDATGSTQQLNLTKSNFPYVTGNKYHILALVKCNNASTQIALIPTGTTADGYVPAAYYANWTPVAMVWTRVGTSAALQIRGNNATNPDADIDFSVRYVMVSDLTAMQDNSATPEEFREKYPLLYYAYGRKLIHNKVAKVITKGANQWDDTQRVDGYYIRHTDGTEVPSSSSSHTGYVPVLPDTDYYFKQGVPNNEWGAYYDKDKNYISGDTRFGQAGGAIFHTPANCYYIRVTIQRTDPSSNICINLSDAEINGQYFPYWERELALDITNQEDTDGNKPFAEGAKSCPVAADEFNEVGGIVRVGVRPYQASDDTDASVITDGVDTAYALTTPVPFTWKEPLNTGIKVSKYGTEEITPAQTENIDNAPFRAVTTYSISIATLVAALHGMGFRGAKNNPSPEPEEPKEEIPVEEQPKEEQPKEEETPVVEPIPEVQNKR